MKYVIAALCGIILLLGWLYYGANKDLASTKTSLATVNAANELNLEAISLLERSIKNTDTVLAGWDADRTTLAGVRNATRQAIREAMRDEIFSLWASAPAPTDAWRLLRSDTHHSNENGSTGSTGGTTGGLPGNADTGKRQ